MAYPKELEERIDKLEKNFNRYQGKIHSLENAVFNTEKEEPECITVQRGDDKRHKVYLNAGDKVVIDGHEISFKRTDEGQLVCDHTAYNPTSEFTVSEEPDYLQVGDQWRDSDGNDYVLSMVKGWDKVNNCGVYTRCPDKYYLINRDTGETMGEHISSAYEYILPNDKQVRTALGIIGSMTKIK